MSRPGDAARAPRAAKALSALPFFEITRIPKLVFGVRVCFSDLIKIGDREAIAWLGNETASLLAVALSSWAIRQR